MAAGKKSGASCIYVRKLDDLDAKFLETMISKSLAYWRMKHPSPGSR